tara:strand:- start:32 stop:472 length:441 start_codon:yes stop_codon:yes gene_type:complete
MTFSKIIKNLFKNKKILGKDLIFLIILFILFSISIDVLRKSYFVLKMDHDTRQSKIAYDYCEGTGSGYIFYIKKKFNIKKLPKIINFGGNEGSPPQNWIFYQNQKIDENKLIVLFNLDKNNEFKFKIKNYKIEDNHKNDCLYLTKK